MVDCLSFQINLLHIWPSAGLGCLSVYLLICLCDWVSVCLCVCLSFSSIQTDLAHCLPSATWLAWKRLGWNWFEVASKHMKDWCLASTAATWIVPSHLSNVPLVAVLFQLSWWKQRLTKLNKCTHTHIHLFSVEVHVRHVHVWNGVCWFSVPFQCFEWPSRCHGCGVLLVIQHAIVLVWKLTLIFFFSSTIMSFCSRRLFYAYISMISFPFAVKASRHIYNYTTAFQLWKRSLASDICKDFSTAAFMHETFHCAD